MSENIVDPERISTVVETGETEAVNDLINELKELDVDERLATFETAVDSLLHCMDLNDGYSRQAVIRIVSALDPATGRMVVETAPDRFDSTPDEQRFADAIERAATIFVAALADEDGRVRNAAVRGLNSLCTGCRLTDDRKTLTRIVADIDALSVPEECEKHVEEAKATARGGSLGGL